MNMMCHLIERSTALEATEKATMNAFAFPESMKWTLAWGFLPPLSGSEYTNANRDGQNKAEKDYCACCYKLQPQTCCSEVIELGSKPIIRALSAAARRWRDVTEMYYKCDRMGRKLKNLNKYWNFRKYVYTAYVSKVWQIDQNSGFSSRF